MIATGIEIFRSRVQSKSRPSTEESPSSEVVGRDHVRVAVRSSFRPAQTVASLRLKMKRSNYLPLIGRLVLERGRFHAGQRLDSLKRLLVES